MEELLRDFFDQSFALFWQRERDGVKYGVAERNLCCRLAVLWEILKGDYGLDGYFADSEYNRTFDRRPKLVATLPPPLVGGITADLILHSRGTLEPDNLIAVEMKYAGRDPRKEDEDRMRVLGMTMTVEEAGAQGRVNPVAGYILGYFLVLDPDRERFVLEEYVAGQQIGSRTEAF